MIKAEIVADSLSPQGDRLISVLATFPRIVLAEVNTHRMLSKNTSSSRAIPFNKMVEAIQNNPFIPIAWQKAHKGMQGSDYETHIEHINLNTIEWLEARDNAIENAKVLNDKGGVTKQLCNRLLEPFMWTTMLITGSKEGWENFFELRCPSYKYKLGAETYYFKSWKELISFIKSTTDNKDYIESWENETVLGKLQHNKGQAEIHMMALAESIYDAMNESTPKKLEAGQWHIPFGDKINVEHFCKTKTWNKDSNIYNTNIETVKIKVSTAMAARTSYTIVGDEKEIDYQKMLELHDRLIAQNPPHSSPMEHCAKAMNNVEYRNQHKGDLADDKGIGWCRNYKGFIQYRHIIETNG